MLTKLDLSLMVYTPLAKVKEDLSKFCLEKGIKGGFRMMATPFNERGQSHQASMIDMSQTMERGRDELQTQIFDWMC